MGRGRRAGHGQVEQGVDREPALFATCRRPAPQGREVIRHTGAVVSRSVTGPASLTYRIGLTCIGELVVKVATPGRAELDDLYATTRTPGRPTSESADVSVPSTRSKGRSLNDQRYLFLGMRSRYGRPTRLIMPDDGAAFGSRLNDVPGGSRLLKPSNLVRSSFSFLSLMVLLDFVPACTLITAFGVRRCRQVEGSQPRRGSD